MNINTSVAKLRQENFKVRVVHSRFLSELESILYHKKMIKDTLLTQREIREKFKTMSVCDARGGYTVVEITTPDGRELKGVANCSRKDTFCKKKAVRIAIGKALRGSSCEKAKTAEI